MSPSSNIILYKRYHPQGYIRIFESFPFKAIRCLTSFINRDFSTKPWNRQKHADALIHPKK